MPLESLLSDRVGLPDIVPDGIKDPQSNEAITSMPFGVFFSNVFGYFNVLKLFVIYLDCFHIN